MIKRLIFDLDNTIILWKDEYTSALKKTMKEFNVNIYYKDIDDVIESLEGKYTKISKEILLNDINSSCNLNLTIDFINRLLINQCDLAPSPDNEMIDTFEYLSKKYEIVLLSNYFKITQEGRLKKIGIRKYFDEIYGGDTVNQKPDKQAFITASGKYKPEECVMIGDSVHYDIDGALSIGMHVIQVDLKNKVNEEKDYPVIKSLVKLKQIL